jgi:hypothetical protein
VYTETGKIRMMLTGECNLCGACCFTKYGAVCENLEILTREGLPNATRCRVYAERYDGMPIRMIARDGRRLRGYYCAKNSPAEVSVIIEMGIKKGVCSLRCADHTERVGPKERKRKET